MEPREIVRFLNYPDRALVDHAVHRANLTEREAEVLDLRYRRELTVETAAELLDVSPATVKNRSGECMRKLDQCWSGLPWIGAALSTNIKQ